MGFVLFSCGFILFYFLLGVELRVFFVLFLTNNFFAYIFSFTSGETKVAIILESLITSFFN